VSVAKKIEKKEQVSLTSNSLTTNNQ